MHRIYLSYHTTEQVLVGYTLGTLFGLGWLVTIEPWSRSLFSPSSKLSPLWNALLIRDCTDVPNVPLVEFEACQGVLSRKRSAQKQKKLF